jgi:hypothetical protein
MVNIQKHNICTERYSFYRNGGERKYLKWAKYDREQNDHRRLRPGNLVCRNHKDYDLLKMSVVKKQTVKINYLINIFTFDPVSGQYNELTGKRIEKAEGEDQNSTPKRNCPGAKGSRHEDFWRTGGKTPHIITCGTR